MASITRRLLFHSRNRSPWIVARQAPPRTVSCRQRFLSTTAPLRKVEREEESDDKEKVVGGGQAGGKNDEQPPVPWDLKLDPELDKELEAKFEKTQMEQLEQLSQQLDWADLDAATEALKQGQRAIPWDKEMDITREEDWIPYTEPGKPRVGFWGDGEEELGVDEDYYGDDITSHAHGELEQHRELREYARLAAWELPLLNSLAKPFELPTAATPFRFRYTSYLGERHPATNKVVVEFCASDMPNLTPLQKDKLIKLAGPRYNPDTDSIKMSCELFDTLPQNKRFLGDTISKLLAEAKDPKETFADVPFDFRHHKPKVRHEFPKEWIMTAERKKYLEEKRQKSLKFEDERAQKGRVVDGQKIIDSAMPFTTPVAEPVMVGGPRGKQLR